MGTFKQLISDLLMIQEHNREQTLSWLNDILWYLMKTREAALKNSIKSGLATEGLNTKAIISITNRSLLKSIFVYLNIYARVTVI